MTLEGLTLVSTGCIVASGVALLAGWFLIRVPRRVAWHRNVMLLATGLAASFLVAYVTRWALYGTKRFAGTGCGTSTSARSSARDPRHRRRTARRAPHQARAGEARFRRHRRLARITLPIWLCVAASGWMIYYMLYRMQFELGRMSSMADAMVAERPPTLSARSGARRRGRRAPVDGADGRRCRRRAAARGAARVGRPAGADRGRALRRARRQLVRARREILDAWSAETGKTRF
jgi:putative membrane protein